MSISSTFSTIYAETISGNVPNKPHAPPPLRANLEALYQDIRRTMTPTPTQHTTSSSHTPQHTTTYPGYLPFFNAGTEYTDQMTPEISRYHTAILAAIAAAATLLRQHAVLCLDAAVKAVLYGVDRRVGDRMPGLEHACEILLAEILADTLPRLYSSVGEVLERMGSPSSLGGWDNEQVGKVKRERVERFDRKVKEAVKGFDESCESKMQMENRLIRELQGWFLDRHGATRTPGRVADVTVLIEAHKTAASAAGAGNVIALIECHLMENLPKRLGERLLDLGQEGRVLEVVRGGEGGGTNKVKRSKSAQELRAAQVRRKGGKPYEKLAAVFEWVGHAGGTQQGGLFEWLATSGGTTEWICPTTNGRLKVRGGDGSVLRRTVEENGRRENWFEVDLGGKTEVKVKGFVALDLQLGRGVGEEVELQGRTGEGDEWVCIKIKTTESTLGEYFEVEEAGRYSELRVVGGESVGYFELFGEMFMSGSGNNVSGSSSTSFD